MKAKVYDHVTIYQYANKYDLCMISVLNIGAPGLLNGKMAI